MVLFSLPDHSGRIRAYHERELFCIYGHAVRLHVSRQGMVRVALSRGRHAGVPDPLQR